MILISCQIDPRNQHFQIIHAPRIIAGDFNTARITTETVGGKTLTFQQLRSFDDFISDCSLSDLKSIGSFWSWNNKNLGSKRIAGRLDRVLCNTHWLNTLPMSYYEYMSHASSDHSPMCIFLTDKLNFGYKPFKFFNFLQHNPGFQETLGAL